MTSAAAQKLKKRAADFEAKKQLEKALALYIQLLEEADGDLDDADLQLYNRVGDLLTRQGNVSEALGWYEKAIDIYAERGFLNNAIALCNKVLRQSPTRSAVYYKLGKISASKGFKNDAKKNFLEYADRMQKAGQIDEAFRALKEFADLCPDQDDIRLMLAEWLTRENRKNEAVEQLETLWNKFEAEGRRPEASATLDRMKAIDPEFVPRPSGAWVSQKSSDLVFLDLATDAPIASAAPAAASRAATPPSSPSPSVVPAVPVPALEGLTLTFVPDDEDAADTIRPDGFEDEASVVDDVPNDPVSGLESMELEPGERPEASELAQMGLMRESTGAEEGLDIAAIAGLESAADEAIDLAGVESSAGIEEESDEARYISLDLDAVMAEPPRARDITLEVELPLVESDDDAAHDEVIDLLAVMATPIAIPAIAPAAADSITPLDILDLSDTATPAGEAGVPHQREPNDAGSLASRRVGAQHEQEQTDETRRDTAELVAIDGSARVTDEIAVVESVEEDEQSASSGPTVHSLDGDETPDAWVDAALGARRDDLTIDRLLTPLHVPVIGAIDAPIEANGPAVDSRPAGVPVDDIEAAKAEAYDFDEFGPMAGEERATSGATTGATSENGRAVDDAELHDGAPASNDAEAPSHEGEAVTAASRDDESVEEFGANASAEGASSLERFFGVAADAEQEINLLDELTPPFMRSGGNVAAVDGFTSGEVASALDSALVAGPNESNGPNESSEPHEPGVSPAVGEADGPGTPIPASDDQVASSGDVRASETSVAHGAHSEADDESRVDSSLGADAPPAENVSAEFDFDFAAADREAQLQGDDESRVDEFNVTEEPHSALDTSSLRAAMSLDTLAITSAEDAEQGIGASPRRAGATPPDEAMIEAAFRDNPIELPLLDVGDGGDGGDGATSADDSDAYRTYDPSERATPDSFLAQPPTFDPDRESFEPEPSLSSDTLSPDEWPNDVAPEVLIDGEWRDEHVGDLVSGEMSAVNGPSSPTPPARFDDLAAAMMWPADQGDEDSNDEQQNGASRLLASQGSSVSFGGVEAQLRRRLEIDPGNWALRRLLGEELIGLGDRDGGLVELEIAMTGFEQLGDLDGARTVADSVLRACPNSVRHHQKRVEYAVRSGNRAQLIEAYVELADALFRSGDAPKAHVVYSRVLELSPGNQRARVALGLIAPDDGYVPPAPTVRDGTESHASSAMLGLFTDAGVSPVVSHSVTEEMPSIDDVTIPQAFHVPSPLLSAAPADAAHVPTNGRSTPLPDFTLPIPPIAADPQAPARAKDIEPITLSDRKTSTPATTTSTPVSDGARSDVNEDFVDLGDWLRAAEPVRSTRMVTSDVAPSGDEQADFDDMLRRFKQGVAENVDEEDFASHYDLGVAFKEMGLVDEAISEFQKALRGNDHREAAYEALGQCFVEKGQMQVAITLMRRAVETTGADDQQLVGVLYLLGFANEAMERHRDALGYYQRVFAVDIQFRDVAKRVAAMEHRTK